MLLSSRPLTRMSLGCGLVLALLAGCDRQSAQKAQGEANTAAPSSAPATPAANEPASGLDTSHKGSRRPDMTFKDAAGHEIRLASLSGKPLLINLWATWCAPCIAELPALDRLAGEKAGKLKVLTISQDFGKPEKVAAFLKDKGITRLQPWLDPETTASTQWQVNTLPTTIYYDAQGREVWRMTGGHDWSSPDTAALLAQGGV